MSTAIIVRPNYCIYVHSNVETGKSYVGKTRDSFKQRWTNHKHAARKGVDTHFYRAIRKYGESAFVGRILTTARTNEEANLLERLYILTLQTYGPDLGYNSTFGGDGQSHPSAETVEKLRAASKKYKGHSAEVRARIGAASSARKRSPETRAKMRAAALGRKHSEETKKKLSEMFRGRFVPQAWRDKISAAQKGKPSNSPEAYVRAWETRRKNGWTYPKEATEQIAAKNRGRKLTSEHRQKISAGNTGRTFSAATRAKISASNKGKHSAPLSFERKEKIRLGWAKRREQQISQISGQKL